MHIRQEFEQTSMPSCDDQTAQSSASESGHGEPKATMPPVEIAEDGLCWGKWGLALIKLGCVFEFGI